MTRRNATAASNRHQIGGIEVDENRGQTAVFSAP
jgi:hypothetical protein